MNGVVTQKLHMKKMTIEKDIKKQVEGNEKYDRSDITSQKTPGVPGTTLSKLDL